MAPIHTHYDNLKVARNAPPEVIRAAYRTLSQKYHPDRNAGDAEAARIMTIINISYAVLSVPDKRQAHDQWIAHQEQINLAAAQPRSSPPTSPTVVEQPSSPRLHTRLNSFFSYLIGNWSLIAFWSFAAFLIWSWANDKPSLLPSESKPYRQSPTVVSPTYVKPATAPNGQPWPIVAGYISGYPQLRGGGLSSVTVDNSGNDSDVFVKLVSTDSAQAYPARQFYIPAFGRFTLKKVTAGSYDIRYRDLNSGGLSRSEAFSLTEIPTDGGTRYSNMTMTLYKVKNGNMQTYGLSETEF